VERARGATLEDIYRVTQTVIDDNDG